MTQTTREWTCGYASASEAGDFYQVHFAENEDDDGHYVLFQSQFEFPQDFDIQAEANAGAWYAELHVDQAILDQQRLQIDARDKGERIRIIVNYTADRKTYACLKHVLKVMLPEIIVQRDSRF